MSNQHDTGFHRKLLKVFTLLGAMASGVNIPLLFLNDQHEFGYIVLIFALCYIVMHLLYAYTSIGYRWISNSLIYTLMIHILVIGHYSPVDTLHFAWILVTPIIFFIFKPKVNALGQSVLMLIATWAMYLGGFMHSSNATIPLAYMSIEYVVMTVALYVLVDSFFKEKAVSAEKERALLDSLKGAFELAKMGTFQLDYGHQVLLFSEEVQEMTGFRGRESVPLDEFMQIVYEEDRQTIISKILQAVTENNTEPFSYRILVGEETKHLEIHWNNMSDEQGNVIGADGYAQDVSEQMRNKQKETELTENLMISQGIAKLGVAILEDTHDFDKPFRCNDMYREIQEYEGDELFTVNMLASNVDPSQQQKLEAGFASFYETGYAKFEAVQIKTFKENTKYLDIYWQKRTDVSDNDVIYNIIQDVTDIVRAQQKEIEQEELKRQKEDAESASRFKSEFLANMSHEIRTPMNGILGFVEQLEKHETDPERLKQFNMIRSSGNTLLHIINDILDFSKIESGKLALESNPVNLYDVISETTGIFSELTGSRQIMLVKEVDEQIPGCIMGDAVRIKQVIFNLLSNAIKFTPEHGTVTLEATFDEGADQIKMAVTDTGIGIPREKLEFIFEAFAQQDTSTTRKFGGTGLGLSISSSLINNMGGTLQVRSEVGKGSTFTCTIPVVYCPEGLTASDGETADETDGAIRLNGHVLVVEDNRTNQMLMGIILDEYGITYDVADDGVEAIRYFNEHDYDVILMDENMPNMNGIEATRQIRAIEGENDQSATPIIAVTANALAEDRQRFLDAGMDDYISKPYEEKDIVAILRQYL
jgi:signal transduction histidine kinase/PAS domain-containing protein